MKLQTVGTGGMMGSGGYGDWLGVKRRSIANAAKTIHAHVLEHKQKTIQKLAPNPYSLVPKPVASLVCDSVPAVAAGLVSESVLCY